MGIFGNNDKKIEKYEAEKAKKLAKKRKEEDEEEQRKLRESEEKLAKKRKIQEEINKKKEEEREKRIEKSRKEERIRLEKEEREEDIKRVEEEEERERFQKEKEEREKRNKIRKEEDKLESKKKELKDAIKEETNKIEQETIRIKKEKEKSQKLIKFYKNRISEHKNKLKIVEKKEKEKLTQKKRIEKKIENKERLYDPNIIKSILDEASLKIFYDLEKKENAYFHYTDFVNRIEIREQEMKEEMKIPQNIVSLSIRYTNGDKYRVAMGRSGGLMDFPSYDAPGYNLRIQVDREEQYLIKKIMSLIRAGFPKMAISDSNFGISAFMEDQNYDEEYSRRIIQKVTQRTCEEFEKLGDVLIDKY